MAAAATAAPASRGFGDGHVLAARGDLQALSALGWHYNWGMAPDLQQTHGLPEFVPMAWGRRSAESITAANLTAVNATALLCLNEVNMKKQSNLTPEQACSLWPKLQAAAEGAGARISSPTINECRPSASLRAGLGGGCTEDPLSWMDRFVSVCPSARFDFVAYHHYSCNEQGVVDDVKKVASRYNKPVWLTEFACPGGSAERNARFASAVAKSLDALGGSVVERYAWFAAHIKNSSTFVGPAASLLEAPRDSPPQALSPVGRAYSNA